MTCRFCQQWNPPGARRCCFCQNELDSAVDQTAAAQVSPAQQGRAGQAPPVIPAQGGEDLRVSIFGRQLPLAQLLWQGAVVALVLLFLLLRAC